MTLDYTSIFLILLNVFVFVLFIVLVYAIFQSFKIISTTEQEVLRQDAYKKALSTIDTTRDEALKIVKDTEYLTDTTKEKMKGEFNTLVKKLSNQLASDLSATLEEEGTRGLASIRKVSHAIEEHALSELKKFEGVSKDMESTALHELESFKQQLHEGTLHNEEAAESQLAKEYAEVKKRLADYENVKMTQIDNKVHDILLQVTRELFDKSLDINTSEKMVMEALSKAKKENMFI